MQKLDRLWEYGTGKQDSNNLKNEKGQRIKNHYERSSTEYRFDIFTLRYSHKVVLLKQINKLEARETYEPSQHCRALLTM